MAQVLEGSGDLSDTQREHLLVIQDNGTDLLTLISDILDQARLDSQTVRLDPAPFDLRDLVDGAIHSMASVAQNKGLEICLLNSLGDDPPTLIADGFRVKQVSFWCVVEAQLMMKVLLNFLSNAIKFTTFGQVTIEWRWLSHGSGVDVWIDVVDTVSSSFTRCGGTYALLTVSGNRHTSVKDAPTIPNVLTGGFIHQKGVWRKWCVSRGRAGLISRPWTIDRAGLGQITRRRLCRDIHTKRWKYFYVQISCRKRGSDKPFADRFQGIMPRGDGSTELFPPAGPDGRSPISWMSSRFAPVVRGIK
jgi:hypothetical protein